MASLRDMVSEYQDDLRNGIAWLAFWREGRSWQAEAFHLDLDDTLYPEDRARLAEIQAADPRAVVVNDAYGLFHSPARAPYTAPPPPAPVPTAA